MTTSFLSAAKLAFLLACAPALIYGQTDVGASAAEVSQALVKGHVVGKVDCSSPGASVQAKRNGARGLFSALQPVRLRVTFR